MKHRHIIIRLIEPKLPLALVGVRLPAYHAWSSNNSTYTPLALIFRRVRNTRSSSMQPINYVSHDGGKVVIAPRINLCLQWAKHSRLLSIQGQPSQQKQSWAQLKHKENHGIISPPFPMFETLYSAPSPTMNRQVQTVSSQVFSFQSVALRHYTPNSRSLAQWQQQRFGEQLSRFTYSGPKYRRPMHANIVLQATQNSQNILLDSEAANSALIPVIPLIQQYWRIDHAALAVSSSAVRSSMKLMNAINRKTKQVMQTAESLPVLTSRYDLKHNHKWESKRNNSSPDTVESILRVLAGDVTQCPPWNGTEAAVPLLHQPQKQQQYYTATASISENQLYRQPFLRQHRKQRQHNTIMAFFSDILLYRRPSIKLMRKSLLRLHDLEVKAKVQRHFRTLDYQFLTKAASMTTKSSVDLLVQRTSRTLDQFAAKSRLPTDLLMPSARRPEKISNHQPSRQESLLPNLNLRASKGRQQADTRHGQHIPAAQVVYRTAMAPVPPPSVNAPSAPEIVAAQPPEIDIDLLSRDVWRQLEKRIRIERERRGL